MRCNKKSIFLCSVDHFPLSMSQSEFATSLHRSHVLQQQEKLFADALRGQKCDVKSRWWEPVLTSEEETVCRWYREQARRLGSLEWTYYIKCYDGPGFQCSQEIPELEKKYGTWMDALSLSQKAPDCTNKYDS